MRSFLVLGCFLSVSVLYGQSFIGKVLKSNTGEPVAFANIFIVELSTGTTTDDNGQFELSDLPTSKLTIQISFIGYETYVDQLNLATLGEYTFELEESHIELEEVVVSVPMNKLQRENTTGVARARLDDLQLDAPVSLAEAVSAIPGVQQNTTGPGIGKPVIRGLSGNRIVTFAQGIRIENQQWGDEHGLGVGAIGIESAEVIKGPASLLYGSDALGGVLFFVDEAYAPLNETEGFISTNFHSNTLGTINNMGLKFNKSRLKLNLFGSYSSHADYKVPELGNVLNSRFNEQNVKASLGYNYKNWITNLRYAYLKNNFGLVDDVDFTDDRSRSPLLPDQEIANHNLSFENTILTGEGKLSMVIGHSRNDRSEFEDAEDEAALSMNLNTTSYNLKWYAPPVNEQISWIAGVQGMHQENQNSGEEILIPDATTNDVGGFGIVSINWNNFQFQGGIRLDQRTINTDEVIRPGNPIASLEASYKGFNYSAGAVYSGTNNTLRVNWSTAFRAPTTSELLSNGVHEGTRRFEIGNPNLKSEKARQIDITYDYYNEHFRFTINPFYKSIADYVTLIPQDRFIEDFQVFEYEQTDASLYGGEIGVHYHPHGIHWLHIAANYATVVGSDERDMALPLIPANKFDVTLRGEFSGSSPFRLQKIYFNYIFNFNQDRVSIFETPTPSYGIARIGASVFIHTASGPIEVTPVISNLFNTSYIHHLSRFKGDGIPNPGRNVSLGITWRF